MRCNHDLLHALRCNISTLSTCVTYMRKTLCYLSIRDGINWQKAGWRRTQPTNNPKLDHSPSLTPPVTESHTKPVNVVLFCFMPVHTHPRTARTQSPIRRQHRFTPSLTLSRALAKRSVWLVYYCHEIPPSEANNPIFGGREPWLKWKLKQ